MWFILIFFWNFKCRPVHGGREINLQKVYESKKIILQIKKMEVSTMSISPFLFLFTVAQVEAVTDVLFQEVVKVVCNATPETILSLRVEK